MRGKHTKLRGLPLMQQPRDIPPEVVRKGLPVTPQIHTKDLDAQLVI